MTPSLLLLPEHAPPHPYIEDFLFDVAVLLEVGFLKGVWLLRTHPVQMCGLIPCKVPAGAGLPSLAPFIF